MAVCVNGLDFMPDEELGQQLGCLAIFSKVLTPRSKRMPTTKATQLNFTMGKPTVDVTVQAPPPLIGCMVRLEIQEPDQYRKTRAVHPDLEYCEINNARDAEAFARMLRTAADEVKKLFAVQAPAKPKARPKKKPTRRPPPKKKPAPPGTTPKPLPHVAVDAKLDKYRKSAKKKAG